jgi:uncharacterized protein (DUF488 family)
MGEDVEDQDDGRPASRRDSNGGRASDATEKPTARDVQRAGPLNPLLIYTVGHSTRTVAQLVEILRRQGIRTLVDIRRFPRSAHNPQFNAEALASELATSAIGYRHEPRLGGRRHDGEIEGENTGWRNRSFRAFAAYMATSEFQDGLQELVDRSRSGPSAIMCSEALPWRCHRSLVADALLACGAEVFDIIGERVSAHRMTPFARVNGTRVTYPGDAVR